MPRFSAYGWQGTASLEQDVRVIHNIAPAGGETSSKNAAARIGVCDSFTGRFFPEKQL